MSAQPLPRDADGTLSSFAWPGGYHIRYFADDSATLCAPCANADGHVGGDADGWRLDGWFVHYEGDEVCAHCGALLVGSYDNPPQGSTCDAYGRATREEVQP